MRMVRIALLGLVAGALLASPAAATFIWNSTSGEILEGPAETPATLSAASPGPSAPSGLVAAGFLRLPFDWSPVIVHATEPSALVLLGTGLLGIASLLRRRLRPRD
jgi:hypothetical protein